MPVSTLQLILIGTSIHPLAFTLPQGMIFHVQAYISLLMHMIRCTVISIRSLTAQHGIMAECLPETRSTSFECHEPALSHRRWAP